MIAPSYTALPASEEFGILIQKEAGKYEAHSKRFLFSVNILQL